MQCKFVSICAILIFAQAASSNCVDDAVELYRASKLAHASATAISCIGADPSAASRWRVLAYVEYAQEHWRDALHAFRRAYELNPDDLDALTNVGKCYEHQGQLDSAFATYFGILQQQPNHKDARHNIALLYHHTQRFAQAIEQFNMLVEQGFTDAEVMFNRGASYAAFGRIGDAVAAYEESLRQHPNDHRSLLNLAALHQYYGDLNIARGYYNTLIGIIHQNAQQHMQQLHVMALHNFAVIQYQLGEWRSSIDTVQTIQRMVHQQTYCEGVANFTSCQREIRLASLLAARTEIQSRRASGAWEAIELLLHGAWKEAAELHEFDDSCLFDALLSPFNLAQRKFIATEVSGQLLEKWAHLAPTRPSMDPKPTLHLGFSSHDITSHPTAYMLEGLITRLRDLARPMNVTMKTTIYAYGKNDNSPVRARLKAAAGQFSDMVLHGYDEFAQKIQDDHLDILFDLQVHTRGTRMQVLARRPSPLIVSFLAFPATSGMPQIDYLVADTAVVPAEHAQYYTEKLWLLPGSYQINHYSSSHKPTIAATTSSSSLIAQTALRTKFGLPSPRERIIVFCNFNKIDKFEPQSFTAWMNLMRHVPNSVLWLLQPDSGDASFEAITANVKAEAAAQGVHPSRVLFAPRVNKSEHIVRHAAADLFLDHFIYGAHSTATDALRGGLPVLTVIGPAFASRVGWSLLRALGSDLQALLGATSVKVFEDTGKRLVQHPSILKQLSRRLLQAAAEARGLFDYNQYTMHFTRLCEMAKEIVLAIHSQSRPLHHLIIPSSS